ncbi:hypothetical protein [Sphingomonas sp. MMS24-J13]|uniref:hypothetical protein n=1 Tax=Sphingomonas sp. MMS24-J13 TaxID=3238686 RepID=UPI00384D31B4
MRRSRFFGPLARIGLPSAVAQVLGGLAARVMPRLYTRPLDTTRFRLVPLIRPELKQAHALAMRLSEALRLVLAG